MKKTVLLIIMVTLTFISCKENKKDKTTTSKEVKIVTVKKPINNINTEKSKITWKGTKPTGSHNGTVLLKSGSLVVENDSKISGEFIIDMTSIVNLDMKGAEGAGKIEGHLSSPDFFDVPKFPTAKFVISSSENKADKILVSGNITIKDITKSITIPAKVSETNGVVIFKSDVFKIDRTDFGITYKSKKIDAALKDKFINDLMEISFTVITKK